VGTTTGISAEREIERGGSRSVMRILLCVANIPGAKPRNDERNPKCSDYAQLTEVVNALDLTEPTHGSRALNHSPRW